MKLTPWYLVAIAPIAIAGWSGAFLGQVAVLAAVVCIFVGTLSLGRELRKPIAKLPAQEAEAPHS